MERDRILRILTVIFLCFSGIIRTSSLLEIKNTEGTFWHITDLHVDQNYSRAGDPNDLCHMPSKEGKIDNGIYGNFMCDSPWDLVDLTIDEMKKIHAKPDFIIWTGDNLPHTRNPNPDWDAVFSTIRNVTNRLRESFPGVDIYPCIGNHDTSPPNIIKPKYENNSVYDAYLEKGAWGAILPESALHTFKHGGFYSHQFKPGLRIISLNTILWYETNSVVKDTKDPADQLKWFTEELRNAASSNEKVYIIGHVAPGFYNRRFPGAPVSPTYHRHFLKAYMDIIKEQSDVIGGQFFAHLHQDMFQIYHYDSGNGLSSSLLASSVTPWHANHGRNVNVSLPVYPSVRLMFYGKTTYLLLNYRQYYLNLSKANEIASKVSGPPAKYDLLYSFTETYDVPDLSSRSLAVVYEKLKSNASLFQEFFTYLTAGKKSVPCDNDCESAQLCSMSCTAEECYNMCMKRAVDINDNTTSTVIHSKTFIFAVSFVVIFILIAFISFLVYCKRNVYLKKRNYLHLSDL